MKQLDNHPQIAHRTHNQNGSDNADTPMFNHVASCQMVDVVSLTRTVRAAVKDALESLGLTRQKCFAAGHLLNEAREQFNRTHNTHGRFTSVGGDGSGFIEWLKKNIPEISYDTANNWMSAARNILKALPQIPGDRADGLSYIDIEGTPISAVISRPADDLSDAARAWRQTWLDFTENKTIKQCVDGLFLDDDDKAERRLKNAINGKTARGAGGGGNRKDIPLFVARKLKPMNTFFTAKNWLALTENQRSEIKEMCTSAILGHDYKLRSRPEIPTGLNLEYNAWPRDLCLAIKEAVTERLKH